MKSKILLLFSLGLMSLYLTSCKGGGFKPDDKAMADITAFADEMKGLKTEYESMTADIQAALDSMNSCNEACMKDAKPKKGKEETSDSLKNDCNALVKKLEDIKNSHKAMQQEIEKAGADFTAFRAKAEKGELEKEAFEKEMESLKNRKAGFQSKINEWTDQVPAIQEQCNKNCEAMEGCCK